MSEQFATSGHSAVMSMRVEDADSLDDYPTPPWATRALVEHVLWHSAKADAPRMTVWEPACGRRIMSDVLQEYFGWVIASDLANYEDEHTLPPDYIDSYLDRAPPQRYQWMITNPPFNKALDFVEKALTEAQCGVAILVRSVWLEGQERYERLFSQCPPTLIGQFVERVPMIRGVWNPKASTATSYAWFVWDTERKSAPGTPIKKILIPPCRADLTMPYDDIRYGVRGLKPWLVAQMQAICDETQRDDLSWDERAKLNRRLGKLEDRMDWLDAIGSTRHD